MARDFLFKLFPVPKFLVQPTIGFDISDNSLKFLELLPRGRGYRLGRLGQIDIPAGTIEEGELKNLEVFKQVLITLKNKWHFNNVAISLPDDHAYTINLILPPMKPEEILSSVELQIEEYVPMPAEEVVFDFDLVGLTSTGQIEVGVSALPKTIVEGYQEAFRSVGLNLLAVETQGEALARTLTSRQEQKNSLIVDLGGNHTAIFYVKNGVVVHASATPIGGQAITRNLQKTLQLDFSAAEKVKITQGLSRSNENQAVFEAIIPVVSAVREEIARRIDFWAEQEGAAKEKVISNIFLIGGQSSLPGLAEYLSVNLDRSVELGNPWLKVFPAGRTVNELTYNEALRYGTAIGLALRNFEQ